MLLRRVGELLALQALQRPHDALGAAGAVRQDDIVDKAAFGRHERVGETGLVVRRSLGDRPSFISAR